jgi:DNA repair exonuclease SbcCD nuclease subunit
MSKIPIITDTHFGARADSLPMQASMRLFYEKVFFPVVDQHQCRTMFHAGDWGERRKFLNTSTANFAYDVFQRPIDERGIDLHIVAGNHDCYYRESTRVNTIAEVYRHNANVHIYTTPQEVHIEGCDILVLPWIVDENRQQSLDLIRTSTCPIVLGHLEISGFQMFRGIPNHEGLTADMFDRFKLVMSGHFHHRTAGDPIVYLGAPYPMIWSDYNDPRGFHLFDTDTHTLEFIENPYSLFVKVIYDDRGQSHDYIRDLVQTVLAPDSPHHNAYVKVIVRSREQPYWYDMLLDSLYKVNAQDIIVVDDVVIHDEDEKDVTNHGTADVDTLTLMKEFVDSLAISCDRKELFAYLQSKYHEAMAASQSAKLM